MSDLELVSFGFDPNGQPPETSYAHLRFERTFCDRGVAERAIKNLIAFIDSIAKTHTVYLRLKPTIHSWKEFEENKEKWAVVARVSFDLPEVTGKPAGILEWQIDEYRVTQD